MLRFTAMMAATILFSVLSNPVYARTCGSRAAIIKQLGQKHHETRVGIGLVHNGGIMELLTSKDGGTWTLVYTIPGGPSCMIAAGNMWSPIKREVEGQDG